MVPFDIMPRLLQSTEAFCSPGDTIPRTPPPARLVLTGKLVPTSKCAKSVAYIGKNFYTGLSYSTIYTPRVCARNSTIRKSLFFSTCARKPPLPSVADRKISNTPVHSALKQIMSPVNLIDSQIFAVPIVHPVVKSFPPGLCRSSAVLQEQAFITPSSCRWMDCCLPPLV